MTDDDRMDRAERIKRMREGRRRDESAEAGPTDATADASDDSAGADPDPADVSQSDASDGQPTEHEADDSAPTDADIDGDAMATAKRVAESVSGVDAEALAEAGAEAVESDDPADADDQPATVDDPSPDEVATTTEEEATRVLEFQLGDERYCLDIAYVEEIVKDESITRVPNTPSIVDGVVDLRGQITTILDPKEVIDIDDSTQGSLIVVFDSEAVEDQGAIGWIVDEVHQVVPISESDLRDSPVEEAYINGVIDRDDQFVLWIEPDLALDAIDEE